LIKFGDDHVAASDRQSDDVIAALARTQYLIEDGQRAAAIAAVVSTPRE
jgi:hypothetical protein